jgi:hypothetical protein
MAEHLERNCRKRGEGVGEREQVINKIISQEKALEAPLFMHQIDFRLPKTSTAERVCVCSLSLKINISLIMGRVREYESGNELKQAIVK